MTQTNSTDLTFNKIVKDYKDKVVNTCFGFVHQTEDAEDIAQEVFIEIYKSLSKFRYDSNLSTWIYRIAVNKSLDFIKAKNRKKRINQLQSIFNSKNEILPLLDKEKKSDEFLEEDDQKKALYAALEKLPVNQKIAITLNKFDDLSAKEIASVMHISLSSVESLIHRAKLNLKKYLTTFYESNMK